MVLISAAIGQFADRRLVDHAARETQHVGHRVLFAGIRIHAAATEGRAERGIVDRDQRPRLARRAICPYRAVMCAGNTPSGRRVDVVNQRFIARKLDRARRCVAISELDTGRQANSLAHRREREAAIGVTHGMAKPGIAFDAIMHVVATLYRQGGFVAEGPKDIAGPRGRAPPLLAGTLDDDD